MGQLIYIFKRSTYLKTTLVLKLFLNPRVLHIFCRSWICIRPMRILAETMFYSVH